MNLTLGIQLKILVQRSFGHPRRPNSQIFLQGVLSFELLLTNLSPKQRRNTFLGEVGSSPLSFRALTLHPHCIVLVPGQFDEQQWCIICSNEELGSTCTCNSTHSASLRVYSFRSFHLCAPFQFGFLEKSTMFFLSSEAPWEKETSQKKRIFRLDM